MANYEVWNSAIAEYFTAGASYNSPIFLSLDEEAVEDVAYKFIDDIIENPIRDFITAIKKHCLPISGSKIDLSLCIGHEDKLPLGVAFLGSLVLAAYHMQEEEGIDETNYFLRLKEILQLPISQGRPDGMPPGNEEYLWIQWNNYLKQLGFEPTAERGSGPQTYIRYPLSQTILRESDKQFLREKFQEKHVPSQLDTAQLGFWLSSQQINRKHLKEGIWHPDPAHVWEFYEAAFRIYEEEYDWADGYESSPKNRRERVHNIESGLYRIESLSGEIYYRIFPKQPERTRSLELYVSRDGEENSQPLIPLMNGFYKPLWEQHPFIDKAIQYQVTGSSQIQHMLFPKKDFWILSPEPNNPQGAYATWRPYRELGEKLLILCKNGLFCSEMENLQKDKLINWSRDIQCSDWTEYYDCMVLSYEFWDYIGIPECRSLVDSLAPKSPANVVLSGGLRDPNQNAWLEGFLPTIKIYGFEKYFRVTITNGTQTIVFDENLDNQVETTIKHELKPDVYEIIAEWNGRRVAVRRFRIISWNDIRPSPEDAHIINNQYLSTAGLHLTGPLIQNFDENQGGELHG